MSHIANCSHNSSSTKYYFYDYHSVTIFYAARLQQDQSRTMYLLFGEGFDRINRNSETTIIIIQFTVLYIDKSGKISHIGSNESFRSEKCSWKVFITHYRYRKSPIVNSGFREGTGNRTKVSARNKNILWECRVSPTVRIKCYYYDLHRYSMQQVFNKIRVEPHTCELVFRRN